ncbi:MAG: Ca-dependent carbohydrate-binding module xylan-binding, partial [Verrucomicrobia bacterium]|nr:Ca-dependent carbohydrate-binding module xylan-binding [Verrucomicrobiota bacterium]
EAEEITVSVKLKAGENKLHVAFTNDTYKEGEYDRNMYIHAATIKAGKEKQ